MTTFPKFKPFSPFCPFDLYAMNGGMGTPAPQSLLNVQKLSLPLDTPVGTQVSVSDGFYVDTAGAFPTLDGFYGPVPDVASTGRISFQKFSAGGNWNDGTGTFSFWNGDIGDHGLWYIQDLATGGGLYSDGDVNFPWLGSNWENVADDSPVAISTTNPALQQLNTASITQGGMFVSGGTGDCVYFKGIAIPTVAGKIAFWSLGDVENNNGVLVWSTNINFDMGQGPSSAGFYIAIGILYYSLSDVATPDLATNWKNASDDSPASITVSSVTVGQLAAGLRIGSVTYAVNGSLNGRLNYTNVLDVDDSVSWNLDDLKWVNPVTIGDVNLGNVAFPFPGTPEVSCVRDDVAAEANWVSA